MARKKKAPVVETDGQKVIRFIETYCLVSEGKLVGKPMRLEDFQKKFILEVYDNPASTRRAYLSLARKNGKTAIIAAIVLAHLVGPMRQQNSQIVSGAMSRDQAGIVFNHASKMIMMSEVLTPLARIIPSQKRLIGLKSNVEYRALAADGHTAHGLSPILAVLDEVGQIRGPQDDFVDAITTSQGAHDKPLLIAISTQAPTDADLFSVWLDDAAKSKDPQIVSHLYTADMTADLEDKSAWLAANPALGIFRSFDDVAAQAVQAKRMPTAENMFRNLVLNQRVSTTSPLISKNVWLLNGSPVLEEAFSGPVFCGLDLSAKTDLTAMVMLGRLNDKWHCKTYCWTPEASLAERSRRDRVPYDVWVKEGFLRTTPGATVDYEFVAADIAQILSGLDVVEVAFDRWRISLFQKELDRIGAILPLVECGQGFKDMSPAVEALEAELLNGRVCHGNHPVLTMCAANAVSEKDAAGNRKLEKAKSTGRIDALVAMAMAMKSAVAFENKTITTAFVEW